MDGWKGAGRAGATWRARAVDGALWAACTGVLAAELSGLRADPRLETAAAAALLAAAFAVRRAHPFAALWAVAAAAVAASIANVLGVTASFPITYALPCVLLAFDAGRRSERTAPVVALAAGAPLVMLAVYGALWVRDGDLRSALTGLTDWAAGLLGVLAAVVAPWLLGRFRRRQAELRAAGWELAERLERARDADRERARLRERARIATEMHDSLGHELALLAVRAAALEMAAGAGPEAEEWRSAAADLRASAHRATLRLREIIGALRDDVREPPGAGAEPDEGEDVAALVARSAAAGMAVRLIREGPDIPAGPAGRAVHRVAREALTNAARYAPGARVQVRVVREDGATEVRVSDGGSPGGNPGAHAAGNGSGLAGLRALVEGMGGSFQAGPERGGGFAVLARIPDAARPGEAAGEPSGATEAARRRALIRNGARRRLAIAVALPLGLGAAVTALGFLLLWGVSAHTVLASADYERLSVGDDRASVERVLPVFDYDPGPIPGEPPAPAGSACSYYLVSGENGLPPVYRLCFAEGRLASKDVIARRD
ncbi:sensor histidine kinase [Nocardiopsis composta]|uniref:histidine kinase n=1 Tax=Nocardiopsis composta TaxID=157465 RepID=A0A7W8VF23_9ACTN|nr:sensor histidine kinase [Nocardiopsis composta]MBB5433524.1 signal transduction histidine kinase [Nocardiopsis composta]